MIMMRLAALISLWSAATAAAVVARAVAEEHVVVHVQAAWGRDSGAETVLADGSRSSPFLSIEAARDHLRVLRASEPSNRPGRRYRVVVGTGTYSPLQLEPQDSGTAAAPIIYEAGRSGGPTVISGGFQVPKSAFQPWAGHPGIVKADISSLGVDFGSVAAGGSCSPGRR